MATPSPVEDSQAWAFVWLGGEMLPAVANITGTTSWDIDVKKTKGSDGATIEDNGIQPAKLSLGLTFVPQFWARIQEILETVAPSQLGGKRKPVEIQNARTDARGIHSVYITDIGLPVVDANGMMSMDVGLLQWVPEPKKSKSGKGKTAKQKVERDPFSPGSLVQLPDSSVVGAWVDPASPDSAPADKEWLQAMQSGV